MVQGDEFLAMLAIEVLHIPETSIVLEIYNDSKLTFRLVTDSRLASSCYVILIFYDGEWKELKKTLKTNEWELYEWKRTIA